LLDNAVKFTPEGGKVELFAQISQGRESKNPSIEIFVSDTGIGIPPEEQEKIFDHFYQAQGGADRSFPGTGLGLALAREFALSHRGWLKVKERPGWSTTFSFGLPLEGDHRPGGIDLQKTPVHLPTMIRGIIQLFEQEERENPEISISFPPEEAMGEVIADRAYLRGILINILQNSLRYRDKGTAVQVRLAPADRATLIVIDNQGPPFSSEELKKIYDHREGKERTLITPGARILSLRIAREILLEHGGALEIENLAITEHGAPKTGVRFTIRLPIPSRL
ncbi:MAG TPA: sensor histidine kinase, partial [Candidatus Manganitrophaceae bacterium]|nr:sensor histidine kinase [Candidatus Manganitrophaceae bacterium]